MYVTNYPIHRQRTANRGLTLKLKTFRWNMSDKPALAEAKNWDI